MRAAAASPAPPEVSASLAAAGCSVLFILLIFSFIFLLIFILHGKGTLFLCLPCASNVGGGWPCPGKWREADPSEGRGACVVPQSPFAVWEHSPELVISAGDKGAWIVWGFNLTERERFKESACQLSHSQASPRKSGKLLGPQNGGEFSLRCLFLCFQVAF